VWLVEILKAAILGIVQGVTEFAPVSSSGHLVLVPWLLGWEPPGLLFDTLVHWGTLVAVLAYFWRDWRRLARAWLHGLFHWDWRDPNARLMWLLVLGTAPAVVVGYLLEAQFEVLFGRPVWVSIFLLITAALLVLAERLGQRTREVLDTRWGDALLIGLAQAAAIAPGISRSGATIATGLLRGFNRPDAARFSFLLSTPVILGAGLLQVADAAAAPEAAYNAPALLVGFLVAAVSGYLSIGLLLRYLQRRRLHAFAVYCVWVGVSCLVVAWLR
jgi:undecaprenyl-diphosphatase